MISLPIVPDGYVEILRVYGDPLSQHFVSEHLKSFEVPFPLKASWNPEVKFKWIVLHKYVGDAVVDALREIMDYKGLEYLQENGFDVTGGTYNCRKKTGGTRLSTHAWGIAIDMVPHLGLFGKKSYVPDFIVRAFKRRGFIWGGDWQLKDAMHYQACKGY